MSLNLQNVSSPGHSNIGELPAEIHSPPTSGTTNQISVQRIGRDARLLTPNELSRYQHMFASNMPATNHNRSETSSSSRRSNTNTSPLVQHNVPSLSESRNIDSGTRRVSIQNNVRHPSRMMVSGNVILQQERFGNVENSSANLRSAEIPSATQQRTPHATLQISPRSQAIERRENNLTNRNVASFLNSPTNAASSFLVSNSSFSDTSTVLPVRNLNYIRANSIRLLNPISRSMSDSGATFTNGPDADTSANRPLAGSTSSNASLVNVNDLNVDNDTTHSQRMERMETIMRERAALRRRIQQELGKIRNNLDN